MSKPATALITVTVLFSELPLGSTASRAMNVHLDGGLHSDASTQAPLGPPSLLIRRPSEGAVLRHDASGAQLDSRPPGGCCAGLAPDALLVSFASRCPRRRGAESDAGFSRPASACPTSGSP